MAMMDFELMSTGIEKVLGYTASAMSIENFFLNIHSEDVAWFTNFENEATNFLLSLPKEKMPKYKIRMDFRLQKKDGNYIRILHQAMAFQQYDNGTVFRTLGVHTDITHLKPFGKPMLSYIGSDGEPSYINVQIGKPLIPFANALTNREKEILALIIESKQNKEIATILNISKLTVDKHRKNMLAKHHFKSSGELIAAAIKNGWI
jgi:DNA-binding CsgD family transcriptional regulator